MTPGPSTDPEAPRRIHAPVERWARERPDALALIDHDGRRLTWREARVAVDAAEHHLREVGVRGGDRVLIVLENCAAAAGFLMACSRLDAWAVLLNARLASPEVERIRRHCEPRALVFTDACSPDAARHAAEAGAGQVRDPAFGAVRLKGWLAAEPEPVEASPAAQVAAMIYTSGTSGAPKGVMLTHRNLLFIASVSGSLRALGPGDRVYAVLPLSHVFGLASTFLGTVNAGGALQLVPRFEAGHLADALAKGGVTVFQGVPAMYARLLEHLDGRGEALGAPSLRYMSAGGSPLDIDWKRRIEARFGIGLNNGYGLTEASPTVAQTRIGELRDDDSIGPALPGVEVRIVGWRGDEPSGQPGASQEGEDLPDGEVGEMWVRGPGIMRGYYRDEAATEAAITRGGWLRSGDLARREPDGALFLVGRAKELIIRSGFNVYPPEVETALNAHPGVVQSAVIGRRVPGNEEVVAFVEALPGAVDEAGLLAFAAERLAPYKRPQHVFILERLPASPTGKVQKHALARLAETLIAERGCPSGTTSTIL